MNIYHRGSNFRLTLQFEGAERLHRMEAISRLKTNDVPAKGRILEVLHYKDKIITGTLNNKGEILESAKGSGKVQISLLQSRIGFR